MATITKSRTVRHREENAPFDRAIKELSPELRRKVLSVLHKIGEIKCISCPKKRNELKVEFKNAVVVVCRAKSAVALDSLCTIVGKLASDASQSPDGVIAAFRKIKKDVFGGKLISAFDDLFGFEATRHLNRNKLKNGASLLTDEEIEKLPIKEQRKIAD